MLTQKPQDFIRFKWDEIAILGLGYDHDYRPTY